MSRATIQRRPTLDMERAFWRAGMSRVAGVDEVGRGALAGPLVAAAVVLPRCEGWALRRLRTTLAEVCDSKLLDPECRQRLLPVVRAAAEAVAIGVVAADELDEIGLAAANRQAMERAVLRLPVTPDALLLDACVVDLSLPQVGAVNADATSLTVAAASIVAKVTRDRFMVQCHEADPRFGFRDHKGYGVAAHCEALRRYGPGSLHRRSFAPVAAAAQLHERSS